MKNIKLYSAYIIFALLLLLLNLGGISRTDTLNLISVYSGLFLAYILVSNYEFNLKRILLMGLILRVFMFVQAPILSDDYYRFYWDGALSNQLQSVYRSTPKEIIENGKEPGLEKVYDRLNSKFYYSIYPVINQSIFEFAYYVSDGIMSGFVTTMRVLQLMVESLIVLFLYYLLLQFNLSINKLSYYIFNPLVIIEFIGNLHLESWMILSLLGFLYFLSNKRLLYASLMLVLGVCAKLLPLMFLPITLRYLGWRKGLLYSSIVILLSVLLIGLYLPSYEVINFMKSIDLYFRSFEFNASIFFVVRWLGFQLKGYDIIQSAGPILSILSLLLILALSYYKVKNEEHLVKTVKRIALMLLVYLLMASIVHPWYVIALLPLCILIEYKFGIVWTYLAFLSYTAYQVEGVIEKNWIIALEYLLLIIIVLLDLKVFRPLDRYSQS
jgi:hypothetical protein